MTHCPIVVQVAESHSGAAIAAGFDILTTLHVGQPLTLRVNVPSQLAPPLRLVLSFLLTLFATLCVGSYLLTRSISLRLRRLAEAADAVGPGLQPAPLTESSPPELRKATRAFNRMQDRMVRYLGSRTRVLTAMSHDLRTPITRLRLRVAFVSDPAGNAPARGPGDVGQQTDWRLKWPTSPKH